MTSSTNPSIEAVPDEVRLAGAFGITPTGKALPLGATAVMAVVGFPLGLAAIVPAVAMFAGFVAVLADDRRLIAKGLREVEAWGFPVEGYRAWLLATEPAFDIELRQDVASDVIESAVAAVDARILVEPRGARGVRIVTPQIELPRTAAQVTPSWVGDRRLLAEIRDRILAPLHADVGIVAMRMGERTQLTALVPARGAEALGSAFRDQAMAAPPALQALVHAGTAQLRPAHEARTLRHRFVRILHAAGEKPGGAAAMTGVTIASVLVGGVLAGGPGGWLGGALGLVGGIFSVTRGNRTRALAVAASVGRYGVPIEGYDDWLISGHPLLDIELATPMDRTWLEDRLRIEAWSVAAKARVSWVREVTWLSETLVRIAVAPTLIEPDDTAIAPFYGGSRILFVTLLADVLVPLHARVGIVAVRMGGYIDRRG